MVTKMKYTKTAQISAIPPHEPIEIDNSTAAAVIGNFWIAEIRMPDIVGMGKWINLKTGVSHVKSNLNLIEYINNNMKNYVHSLE